MATLRIPKKSRNRLTTKPTQQPTKRPTKRPTKKRPTLARARTRKQRTDALIAQIRAQLAENQTTAYQLGQALIELRDPEIWKLYAETTFKGFIQQHVMPYSTAARLVSFAETYTKPTATQIGLERGVQLKRLAKIKQLGNPETLWKTNAVLAKNPTRRTRDVSAAELQRMTQAALLQAAKKPRPKASPAERQALKAMKRDWAEAFDLEADIDLDLKNRKLRIEIDLDQLLD